MNIILCHNIYCNYMKQYLCALINLVTYNITVMYSYIYKMIIGTINYYDTVTCILSISHNENCIS